jgi:hypothetical protein
MEDKLQKSKLDAEYKDRIRGKGLESCKLLPQMEKRGYIYRRRHSFVYNEKTKLHYYKSKSNQ